MKRWLFVLFLGGLFLVPALASCQDRRMERVLPREPRLQSEDLRVTQLEMTPDPVRQGQRVSFRITVANQSRYPGRISLFLKDRDEVISEIRDVNIFPGDNRIGFPETPYRFARTDHCFTVEADIEHNRRPIDVAREFCARQTGNGWSLRGGPGIGPLFVEDLDMSPDPVASGQDIRFRLKLRNDGRPIRGDIRIQDKDQVVVQGQDVSIPRGLSEFQFPRSGYSFQRFDHCFTVIVDVERTPQRIDAAREFCAKPTGWTIRP